MCQDKFEKEFLACLDELRAGTCSKESKILIKGLKRELPKELEEQATCFLFQKVLACSRLLLVGDEQKKRKWEKQEGRNCNAMTTCTNSSVVEPDLV